MVIQVSYLISWECVCTFKTLFGWIKFSLSITSVLIPNCVPSAHLNNLNMRLLINNLRLGPSLSLSYFGVCQDIRNSVLFYSMYWISTQTFSLNSECRIFLSTLNQYARVFLSILNQYAEFFVVHWISLPELSFAQCIPMQSFS